LLKATDDWLLALPKAELHVHLDGSLRPLTLAELALERNRPLPEYETEALGTHMLVSDARNLEEYLDRFALTLSVMQDREAIERIAYELAADHHSENVRYLEARFCPALNTHEGLQASDALEAALDGLARAEADFGIVTRVIVCALRTLPAASSTVMAELAVAYRGRGVCAFDLAGAEAGYPARDHVNAFRLATAACLPITVHAGEGYGPASLRQAIELAHASRIGHGTRLEEDPELMAYVRDQDIPLEVCITSNVQTRVAPTYAEHPVRRYFDFGIPVALCTDNRLMSGVTLTDEYGYARDELGFSGEELARVARTAFESAYVSKPVKAELLATFDAELEGLRA
jgi:adenosine deaminase